MLILVCIFLHNFSLSLAHGFVLFGCSRRRDRRRRRRRRRRHRRLVVSDGDGGVVGSFVRAFDAYKFFMRIYSLQTHTNKLLKLQ